MYRALGPLFAISLASCSDAPAAVSDPIETSSPAVEARDIAFDVTLRSTGRATIHASVYANPRERDGASVLAVHGFTTTGLTFAPLARAIFDDRFVGRAVKRVIAIDLPGHGNSGFPTSLPDGIRFGDLTIDDNVDIVLQTIDALDARGLAPQIVIAHSAGGLLAQAAQEALLADHSSLAAHGVRGVVLLAPVPPHGHPWHTGPASGDPTSLIVNDPVLGSYFQTTPDAFVAGLFGTTSGQVVPGAPTPAEVVASRYIAPEPLAALLQLVEAPQPLPTGGTITVPRPTVRAGAFAFDHGTLLSLVSFREDIAVPAGDLADLYEYLTADSHGLLERLVSTPDAVHAMYISNPTGVLDALRPMLATPADARMP